MKMLYRALLPLLVLLLPAQTHAAQKVALLIGNSAYESAAKLITPISDVNEIAERLKSGGFDVSRAVDLGLAELKLALDRFEAVASNADIALVYYAGHGISIKGESFLIPVDAKLASSRDIPGETLPLSRLVRAASQAKQLKLVLIDASRSNPFLRTMRVDDDRPALSVGMVRIEPGSSDTLVAFSAKAGTLTADGAGRTSPFANALVANLLVPGLDVRLALGRVRDQVVRDTAGTQEPMVYGSLGDKAVALAADDRPSPQQTDAADFELAQRLGTREAWETFLATHQSGYYAELARLQEQRLAQQSRPTSADQPSGPVGQAPSQNSAKQEFALQPVYFATNRVYKQESSPLQLSAITSRRSMNLKYGLAVVSVPRNHVLGQVERPRFKYLIWQYEKERDEDHFRMKSIESLSKGLFLDRLRNDGKSVLLFIHGYNVTFQDAVFKAAQIAYDANFSGSAVVFSWPSAGELLKYDYDRESADFSGGDLLQLIRLLTEEVGDKRVYIVAHSLGNQVLVNALQQAFLSRVKLNIAELVLAAPDVDKDVFIKKAAEIKSVAQNMTMYVSAADKALLASDRKAWGSRIGYVNATGPHLVDGIETIDVTSVGDDMFGLDHGTYSASRAVLDDLGRLISSAVHLRPNERTPTLRFMPDKDNVKYWLYAR